MDLYCPCGMCVLNRREMVWSRGGDERDVRTHEDIRRLMRERPFRVDLTRKPVRPEVILDAEDYMRRVMDKWLRGS